MANIWDCFFMEPGRCITPGGSNIIPMHRLKRFDTINDTTVKLTFNRKAFINTEALEFEYEFPDSESRQNRINDLFELIGK